MIGSNWNLRFPRTTRCDGHAIYHYKTPVHRRLFYAFIKHGWWVFALFLAVACLTGCVDMQAEEDTALAVSDLAKMEGAK